MTENADPQAAPRTPQLTEAAVAFLLDHRRYPGCTMASLTIREWLEKVEAEARSLVPAQDPLVDSSCDCKACTDRTTEMYDMPGGCSNCGAQFTVRARKGDKMPLSVDCPRCDVTVYGWRSMVRAASPAPSASGPATITVGPCSKCGWTAGLMDAANYLRQHHEQAHGLAPSASGDLRAALTAFFEDIDADWSNDNFRPGTFAFRFRAAADRLRLVFEGSAEGAESR
jgi:hypothetical protein